MHFLLCNTGNTIIINLMFGENAAKWKKGSENGLKAIFNFISAKYVMNWFVLV